MAHHTSLLRGREAVRTPRLRASPSVPVWDASICQAARRMSGLNQATLSLSASCLKIMLHHTGSDVEYFSQTKQAWICGRVTLLRGDGLYKLANEDGSVLKDGAVPSCVRPRRKPLAPESRLKHSILKLPTLLTKKTEGKGVSMSISLADDMVESPRTHECGSSPPFSSPLCQLPAAPLDSGDSVRIGSGSLQLPGVAHSPSGHLLAGESLILPRTPLASSTPRVVIDYKATRKGSSPTDMKTHKLGPAAMNTGFQPNPAMIATSDWRGTMAAQRPSPLFDLATRVVDASVELMRRTRGETDVSDSQWLYHGEALTGLLGTADPRAQERSIFMLSTGCQKILAAEQSLVCVPAPAKIFGDIHGQFRDLLLLFEAHGFPSHRGGDIETTAYVFNGDWVDRGAHQLEVVVLLFALKVLYPTRVYLVRGNHEFRSMNTDPQTGFLAQCKLRFGSGGPQIFEACHGAFDWVPIAALVHDSVLVLHGGLGDGSWGLDQLRTVRRPIKCCYDSAVPPCVLAAMWSDPTESDNDMARGVHASPRGVGIQTFGPDVTEAFCRREGVQMVVRAHQFVQEGVKFMHGGRLTTVFSARNYFQRELNDSAFLLLALDHDGDLRVRPKCLLHADNSLYDSWMQTHSK